MPKVKRARKYILSIDGGGFRGLSCLITLHHVMRMLVDDIDEDPIPSPCEVFDMICGTSTGGLIAILLGRLRLDCLTAIGLYKQLGPSIFGQDDGAMWGNLVKGERFSSSAFEKLLKSIVKEHTGDGNSSLKFPKYDKESVSAEKPPVKVFVTTVSSGAGASGVEAYRLRSYESPPRGVQSAPLGHDWTIYEAARATSAAPAYFAPLHIGLSAFQDAGGSGFNNPVIEALNEAEMLWPPKKFEYVVLSLGTGLSSLAPKDVDDSAKDSERESKLRKVISGLKEKVHNIATVQERLEQLASHLVKVATDSELTHLNATNRFLKMKKEDDYFRFNPPQGLGDLNLADYMSEGLVEEITNVWLRTPDGKESTYEAATKLKHPYDEKKVQT